jgi:hypothetical protein
MFLMFRHESPYYNRCAGLDFTGADRQAHLFQIIKRKAQSKKVETPLPARLPPAQTRTQSIRIQED